MELEAEREAKLDKLLATDERYPKDAYTFVCRAVNIIVREIALKSSAKKDNHISGLQLLLGMKKILLAKYGCMAIDILNAWNITCTDDFGNIVFSLAEIELLGTSNEDSPEDFHNRFNFYDAFIVPFQATEPARPMPVINV